MSILNDVKETLTTAGRDVSQKAKEVTGVTKLKLDIKEKEDELDRLYIELGKLYYDMHKEAEMPVQQITNISTRLNEIADLREEMLRIQGACNCPQCGFTMPEGTAFCSKCGTKMEKTL